jgi:hypothetical protein
MEKQEQLIVELVAKRKFNELIQHCEEVELDVCLQAYLIKLTHLGCCRDDQCFSTLLCYAPVLHGRE